MLSIVADPVKIANFIEREIKQTLKDQGHYNTGKTEKGLSHEISYFVNGFEIIGVADSGVIGILEKGVIASRIPFRVGKAEGGNSNYINGLIMYYKAKGFAYNDARRKAFATAKKQKSVGMPTKDKERKTNGLQKTFTRIIPQLDVMVMDMADDAMINLITSDHFKL